MLDASAPLVAVIMGSKSDWETMRHADEMLTQFGVPHESKVMSAHRTPALPMAIVPTGMPAGICTVDRSESMPLSAGLSMGTPSTGRTVWAATTPARCAAPPAAAIMTSMPRASASAVYSAVNAGVR